MDDMSENAKSEQYQVKNRKGKQPHRGGGSDSAALHLFSD